MAVQRRNSNSGGWISGGFIGKGSYGTVSLGVRESDGGVFAVKSAAKDCFASVEALENEIRILRSVSGSSPFIVGFYGDDETPTHRNLYLEYVPGGDASVSGGVSDVDLIRSYAWCLVTALKSVHSRGVVHCDVKGSNVLLCSGTGIAKLADFGTAIKLGDDQRRKIVPRGSPLWMAPEVVRRESQGFEADIWSLGCTVLEMFTGKPAWQDRGAHTLYQIGYSGDLPEFPSSLPGDARDFLEKCLVRDPALRWSCDQLLQHPFLLPAPATKITESTPRGILDFQTLIDDHDDHTEDDDDDDFFDEVSARARVSKLATSAGVNWEDEDGWVEVRGLTKPAEAVTLVVNSEFSDAEEGKVGISDEVEDSDAESDGGCDCDTWVELDGEDEVSGGDRDQGGSCWVQSGGGDSCGGVRREKLVAAATTAVLLLGFSFFTFLIYQCCILVIWELIKVLILVGAIAMVQFFGSISLRSLLDSSLISIMLLTKLWHDFSNKNDISLKTMLKFNCSKNKNIVESFMVVIK